MPTAGPRTSSGSSRRVSPVARFRHTWNPVTGSSESLQLVTRDVASERVALGAVSAGLAGGLGAAKASSVAARPESACAAFSAGAGEATPALAAGADGLAEGTSWNHADEESAGF